MTRAAAGRADRPANLLHDGLALDGLDGHDTEAVISGLCAALSAADPGAAVPAADRAGELGAVLAVVTRGGAEVPPAEPALAAPGFDDVPGSSRADHDVAGVGRVGLEPTTQGL